MSVKDGYASDYDILMEMFPKKGGNEGSGGSVVMPKSTPAAVPTVVAPEPELVQEVIPIIPPSPSRSRSKKKKGKSPPNDDYVAGSDNGDDGSGGFGSGGDGSNVIIVGIVAALISMAAFFLVCVIRYATGQKENADDGDADLSFFNPTSLLVGGGASVIVFAAILLGSKLFHMW